MLSWSLTIIKVVSVRNGRCFGAPMNVGLHVVLDSEGLQALLDRLKDLQYRVIGPTLRDGAIIYDDLNSVDDLPRGWTDEQHGGHYRVMRREDEALFGYAVGPSSWKRFLHPPIVELWRAEREDDSWRFMSQNAPQERLAFVGVRACELEAIRIQDRVLLEGQFVDPIYRARTFFRARPNSNSLPLVGHSIASSAPMSLIYCAPQTSMRPLQGRMP